MYPPYEPPYSATRPVSTPSVGSQSRTATRSATESSRFSTSSIDSQRRPYPVEPRTFGSTTVCPATVRAAATGFQLRTVAASGPPWTISTADPSGVGGTIASTGICSPSGVGTRAEIGCTSPSVAAAGLLVVRRSALFPPRQA
jgi:hypothetical protein